jgi:hypothetical protein
MNAALNLAQSPIEGVHDVLVARVIGRLEAMWDYLDAANEVISHWVDQGTIDSEEYFMADHALVVSSLEAAAPGRTPRRRPE